MAINKKLIKFATQARFDIFLANGDIDTSSVVFIEDTGRLWTQGRYYDPSWGNILNKPTKLSDFTDNLGIGTHMADNVKHITAAERTKWNTASGWGNHSSAGYYNIKDTTSYISSITDFNDAVAGTRGLGSTQANMPTSGYNDVVNISQFGTADLLQIVYPFRGDGKFYMRNRGSGIDTWSPWLRIWHSGNLANGTTSQYIRGDGSLATYTDTTYSLMSLAELNKGTETTNRVVNSKNLNDWLNGKNYATVGYVDGIEIGGRNLLLNTKSERSGAYNMRPDYILTEKPIVGETYTLSGWFKFSEGKLKRIMAYNSGGSVSLFNWTNSAWVYEEWFYFSRTFTWSNESSSFSANDTYIRIYGGASDGLLSYAKLIKLEKGNKATDWTPAPEDQVSDWSTTDVNSFSFIKNKPSTFTPSAHTHTFASLTSKPTTLAGYNITDAYTKPHVDTSLNGKVSKSGDTITGQIYGQIADTSPMFRKAVNANSGGVFFRMANPQYDKGFGIGLDGQLRFGNMAQVNSLSSSWDTLFHTGNMPTLTAGNGLSGGGALNANRTITLGTPSNIDAKTTNSVSASSHTHALTSSTVNFTSLTDISNTLNGMVSGYAGGPMGANSVVGTWTTLASNNSYGGGFFTRLGRAFTLGKENGVIGEWQELAYLTSNVASATTATNLSRSILAGNGLSGGGQLTASQTLTLGTPGTLTATSTNSVTSTSHTHSIDSTNFSVLDANRLNVPDTRSVNDAPSDIPNRSITAFFKTNSVVQTPPVSTGSSYAHILNMNGYNSGNSGGGGHTTQLAFGDSLAIRQSTSTSAWGAWTRLALVTDNVASATKLQTARTLTIGKTGKTFDGTANPTWTLAEMGVAAATHTHTWDSITNKPSLFEVITIPAGNLNYMSPYSGIREVDLSTQNIPQGAMGPVGNVLYAYSRQAELGIERLSQLYLDGVSSGEARLFYRAGVGNIASASWWSEWQSVAFLSDIDAKHQYVTSLPSSPQAGVFYYVKQ